jgi:rod shape-determining protein MreC
MKPQYIAVPLLILLVVSIIGVWAGPLWVAEVTMPFRQGAAQASRNVGGFGAWLEDVQTLRRDRESLQKERNQLLAKLAKLNAVERENRALKEQYKIGQSTTKNSIVAHTAGLTQEGNASLLLIDQGSAAGVKVGQMVLSQGVLVGRIAKVGERSALVELPISLGAAVPVVVRHESGVTKGVVEGNFNLTAKLTQVLPTEELKVGDVLETSSEGNAYVPGLVVGKVGSISKSDAQLFQTASVTLLWDIKTLELVFVQI